MAKETEKQEESAPTGGFERNKADIPLTALAKKKGHDK
jgi:hypothetical protein